MIHGFVSNDSYASIDRLRNPPTCPKAVSILASRMVVGEKKVEYA